MFDTKEIPVAANRGLSEEFLHNLQVIFTTLEPKLGKKICIYI